MALIRCSNTNFAFVLNTSYCKCIKIIKRLITNDNHKTEYISDSMSSQVYRHMINLRQIQAKRSILVHVNDDKQYDNFLNICEKYGKIISVYKYFAKFNEKYVLVELNSTVDVLRIKGHIADNMSKNDIYFRSHVLSYRNIDTSFILNERKDITRKALEQIKVKDTLREEKSGSMQMIALYDTLKITELDVRQRFFIAQQTLLYLRKLFYNICIIPFGSSVNGFGQTGCDLDLLCTRNESVNNADPILNLDKLQFMTQSISSQDESKQKQFLETIGTIMNMCIPEIGNVRKILQARVPIIKFSYLATDTECDLSNANTSGLKMSEALYAYGMIDWRIKPLVCTIRTWAKYMSITKENPGSWITNHSLTLLVLFYLQIKKILPSLNIIEFSKRNSIPVDETNCHQQSNDESLYNLLYGFFQYYNSFNFDKSAICIREAKIKAKITSSPMYIYNPYNKDLNISRNINTKELMHMKTHIQTALRILDESNYNILNLLGLSCKATPNKYTVTSNDSNANTRKNKSKDEFDNKKLIVNKINATLRAEKVV